MRIAVRMMSVVLALMLLVGAGAAGSAQERATNPVAKGKYSGHLYVKGDSPAAGWKITFKVVKKGKKRFIKPWGRNVVMYCYPGPIQVQMPFYVPRTKITGHKVVKNWGNTNGRSGVLKLRFRGNRVTGSLKYEIGECFFNEKIKMKRVG